ncbi:MAG: PAS domain-containing sensor histidine kinase [Chitinophagaceae bacterium]|nr:PAS domain-containing sensor histidine kinase [Chitinophagaceae bacterium]
MDNKLSQSEVQFKALFEFASEGILVANQLGTIILANPAAEYLFGYDKDELINQKVEVLIPRKIAQNHTSLRDKFHQKPSPRSMGTGRDLFGLKKDGTEFPVEVSLSPFSSDEGVFVIAFVIDISIRKKLDADVQQQKKELEKLTLELEKRVKDRTMILEEALQQLEISREELTAALDKEKELNEMKTRFVSMASHEFRTPLATILSSLSLVSKYGELDEKEKQQRHIVRIKESINHLTDLLNDVLSISKLEEGKTTISFEAFDITIFTAETIHELQLLAQRGQQIVYKHEGRQEVMLDKKGLRIILFNLISNAIKFSPEKSSIEVYTKANEIQTEIIIKDFGVGISKEDQENLFQRFFRGRNVTNIQGTGLGLSIVARYIELFNGSIHVESEVNEGTTFNIALPNNTHHE